MLFCQEGIKYISTFIDHAVHLLNSNHTLFTWSSHNISNTVNILYTNYEKSNQTSIKMLYILASIQYINIKRFSIFNCPGS